MKSKCSSILCCIFIVLAVYSCNKKTVNSNLVNVYQQISPNFDADSAYSFVDKQVAFGPRVPNTPQHTACGNYLLQELKRFGAEVTEQPMTLKTFDGTVLKARNIIGSYGLDKEDRILLFAHWDTRPFADQDANPANHHAHILGANDAASGVGVLLEVARILQLKSPELGVDIIFFDAEDYGTPSFVKDAPEGDWWCLGSQYWAKNPHKKEYTARFGILLDMVGAPNATFRKEMFSKQYADNIVDKVWRVAGQLDYGAYFVGKDGGRITDDHVPINQIRLVPSIDIIQYDEKSDTGFGSYWHTVNDDMTNVSKETLKAVGQTILEVVYLEKK